MALTDKDQELRKGRMTATRIVKAAGLSPYGGPHDVFRELVEGYEWEGNEATARGNRFEQPALDWYSERTGIPLAKVGTIIHPKHSRICATPDGLPARDPDRVVEAKTLDFARLDECGEEGTDQIPQDWIAQTQVQMGCTGMPWADVAVLFGVSSLKIYRVPFDGELFGLLVDSAEKFLRDYVDKGVMPPIDGSDGCGALLASRFQVTRPVLVNATPEAARWANALKRAREMADDAEALKKEAENHLKAMIGEAEGMTGDGWRIAWKTTKGRPSTDWEAVCREAGVPAQLVEKHTKRNPYRAFRPTFGSKE